MIKVNLPNYEESMKPLTELSKEEVRSRMKERGLNPPNTHIERPIFLSTTGDIFEAYVPPEGDGKVSFITKEVSHVKKSQSCEEHSFFHMGGFRDVFRYLPPLGNKNLTFAAPSPPIGFDIDFDR